MFALFSISFWVLSTLFILSGFVFVEQERPYFMLLDVIAFIVFLQFIAHINLFGLLMANPLISLGIAIAYLVLGGCWSLVKWLYYTSKTVKDLKANFPTDSAYSLQKTLGNELDPSRHKGRIIFWMSYWPVSFLWFLLNEPVQKMYNFLYDIMYKTFKAISNRAIAQIK